MCCLFGLLDYRAALTVKEKVKIIHALATASEARGTDAAGIAYRSKGHLHVYKRPLPGRCLPIRLSQDARVIMGHTRLATQGSAKKNFNNHPFQARAGGEAFALAHNGMISNELALHREFRLPRTSVQTDSYVAVQLLERGGAITTRSLGNMAEKLEGSFAFTVLDSRDDLYFVRGNNPLCIRRFPKRGIYLYASTGEILDAAVRKIHIPLGIGEPVEISSGDILMLDAQGEESRSRFDDSRLWMRGGWGPYGEYDSPWLSCSGEWPHWKIRRNPKSCDHVQAIKSVAGAFGLSGQDIDALLQDGFTAEEIEDYLYCGEL